MLDIAKFETFRNFTVLNKALLFLHKTTVQSVPIIQNNSKMPFWVWHENSQKPLIKKHSPALNRLLYAKGSAFFLQVF